MDNHGESSVESGRNDHEGMKKNFKFQPPKPRETRISEPEEGVSARVGLQRPWPDSVGELVLKEEALSDDPHPFDLEERTARFGEAIIHFSKKVRRGPGNDRLI